MTISSTTNTISYTGNGSTVAFSVPYVFFGTGTTSEIQVVQVIIATGVETVKSNGSDYTVSGGSGGTGTVTASTAPANTVKWVINRTTTQTQETDYVENDPFPAESHEEALDRLTAVDQEQQRALDRTAQLPEGYTGSFNPTLPINIIGNTVLAFNSDATAFEVGPTTAAISGAAADAAAAAASATSSANSATSAAASAASAEGAAGTQNVDLFNGTGSQTAFTLSAAPVTENNTSVYVSGVYQQKSTYSISGTTLTFSAAPPSGTGNVEVMHLSTQSIGVDPSIGTVTTGAAGSNAAVSITSGGVLSFTIPRGNVGNTGSTGSTGTAATIAVGSTTTGSAGTNASVVNNGSSSAANFNFTIPKGDQGAAGNAATIAVGTVTTGAAGSSASIVNGGSSSAASFNFTIPKGDTGNTGSTGSTGAAATIAAGSATGLSAGASPTVTNSGSSSAATFNFGIPAGATGSTGSAATIAVGSTTTGAAGSSASVANSGSSSAATFNFTIPKGDTGTTGTAATIAAGTATGLAAGASPTVTNSGSSSAATFNFGIPAGATGNTGNTGSPGAAATIAAGTATGLAVGASPTVTNGGTSSAAQFNFGIPVGATGATGNTGSTGSAATIAVGSVTTGAAGSSATVTNSGTSAAATFNFAIPQGIAGQGSGDVVGPSSATDNGIARFDATTGKLLQNSTVTVSDTGTFSTGTNANLELDPNGSGKVVFKGNSTKGSGQFVLNCEQNSHGIVIKGPPHSANASYTLTLPNDDGSANQVLKTDGSGTLAWVDRNDVTLAGSLDYLTISGQEITRNAIVLTTDVSGTLPIANGGTNATSASAALTSLGAASRGANSDITSITGLTTDLTVAQGGTGASTFTANGLLVGNGTGAVTATAVGTSGQILTSNGSGSAPTFQAAAAGGATDINGLSDGVTNSSGGTVGLGTGALASDDGTANGNTALGYQALNSTNSNFQNTAVGYRAGKVAVAGSRDLTLVGHNAGQSITTASHSTFIGSQAGGNNTTGQGGNTAIGAEAGGAITTGYANVMLGNSAGYTTTTSRNVICIGASSEASSATVDHEITLGDTNITKFRIPGINFTVKDSTATDNYVLTVDANGEAGWEAAAGGGASDINGLSDGVTNSSGGTVGLGTGALANDDGSNNDNTALGKNALNTCTSGQDNVAIGSGAFHSLTTGRDSVGIGRLAGYNITTGQHNIFVGSWAGIGASGAAASGNIGIGYQALRDMSTSTYNVALGYNAGENITTGGSSVAIGKLALGLATTGTSNVAVGNNAGDNITTGSDNIVIGNSAYASSATVQNEITLGNTSVTKFRIPGINWSIKDTTATEDYVLTVDANGEAGWEAAGGGGATSINGLSDAVTYGTNSIGLGTDALSSLNGEHGCIALGEDALKDNTSGVHNVGIGHKAGGNITTGAYNTVMGYEAAQFLATGVNNVFIGAEAGNYALGGYNVAIGYKANRGGNPTNNVTANYNVSIGYNALGAVTTGSSNTVVGMSAGNDISTGANNICLGRNSDSSSATASNEVTFGDSGISAIRCQVQTISSLSDRRDKKDIEELPLGVDFINTLKPVKFTWNMRDGAKVGEQEAGFIAQDLDEAQIDADAEDYLSLVLKNNPEKLEASYGKLVPVLVKAVQELSAEILNLKKEIENG